MPCSSGKSPYEVVTKGVNLAEVWEKRSGCPVHLCYGLLVIPNSFMSWWKRNRRHAQLVLVSPAALGMKTDINPGEHVKNEGNQKRKSFLRSVLQGRKILNNPAVLTTVFYLGNSKFIKFPVLIPNCHIAKISNLTDLRIIC